VQLVRNLFSRAFIFSTAFVCAVLFSFALPAAPALANVRLPSVLSDNMVLQKDRVLYFWGLSDPQEIVTVMIGDKRYATTADDKGAWWVKIPAQNRTTPFDITVRGNNILYIHNVITGDVWMCAGQSNMYAPLNEVDHTPQDIEQANLPNLRLFKEEPNCAGEPEFDGGGRWVVCTPETVKDFSAIGYFFGRELLQKRPGVLGLIQATRAGSAMHTWVSREALEKTPYKGTIGETEENFEQYKKLKEDIKEARANGEEKELRRLLKQEKVFKKKVNAPTCAYNALIAPIEPYQMKGVLWYQGENDIGEPVKFGKLFLAMIQDMRERFKFSTLPFYYVQLPPIGTKKDEPEDSYYAELRESQAQVQKAPYTYMIITTDTGHGNDIPMHPRDKKTIAQRLAAIVLATQYKEPLKCFGPTYDTMNVEGNTIRVHLRRGEQLLARGGAPKGFELAGEDKIFHWATARIDGDSIVVSAKKVKKPVAVRYSWADNPTGNVFSSDEIPLLPFRSDNWAHRKPEDTSDKKTAATPGGSAAGATGGAAPASNSRSAN
jgi:sialate O-acetylesterase